MNGDIIFKEVTGPELLEGSWYVTLHNQREEIKIKVDEAFAPLIAVADQRNDNYVKVFFSDLLYCLDMGDVTLQIVQYDLQKCYVRIELWIDDSPFMVNIETWRAIAFSKAYSVRITCPEIVWYDIIDDLTTERISNYHSGFLHMALSFVRHIADDPGETQPTRQRAEKIEFSMYQDLAKRKTVGNIIGGLMQSK